MVCSMVLNVPGPGSHGESATPFQLGQHGALGADGTMGSRVVERLKQRQNSRVVKPAFDPQGPLSDRRQEARRAQSLGDVMFQTQPPQPGAG
jgi:hypothetical protein